MAVTVARLQAVLSANTRDFDRAMNRSETRMGKVGKAAGIAGIAIAGGLAVGIEKSVHAALAAEVANRRLQVAFKNAHLRAKDYAEQIDKVEFASRKLGFTDEEVKQGLGSLIVSTGSARDAMKQLSIAEDLARFKGVDLQQAVKALTMAHAGSLRPLKQLGIDIPKVRDAQDALARSTKDHTSEVYKNELATAKLQDKAATFANVLQTVTDKVHGQADAYSTTAAGSMAQFRAQVDHIEVAVGEKLLPVLTRTLQFILTNWPKVSTAITQAWAQIKPSLDSFIAALRQFSPVLHALAAVALPAFKVAVDVAAVSLRITAAEIRAVATVVKTMEAAFLAVVKPLSGPVLNAIHGVNSAFQRMLGWINSVIGAVRSLIGWLGKIHVPHIPHIGIPGVSFGGGGGGGKSLTGSDKQMLSNTVPQVRNAVEVARENGWKGSITSGYRTYAQQAALYQRYLHGGPLAAKPGTSSHETGQAVDVTDYGTFGGIMGHATPAARLYNRLGGKDPVHWSVSGYDKGGWLMPGATLAINNTGRPERVISGNGDNVVIPVSIGGDHVATILFDMLRRKAKVFERNNSRPAFGGFS